MGILMKIGAAAVVGALAIGPVGLAQADSPPLPKSPQTINIIDVGGLLALTQAGIENYRKTHPELVAKFTFTKAPAPELAGKLKAQQEAGRADIDLGLTGTPAISPRKIHNLYTKVRPAR